MKVGRMLPARQDRGIGTALAKWQAAIWMATAKSGAVASRTGAWSAMANAKERQRRQTRTEAGGRGARGRPGGIQKPGCRCSSMRQCGGGQRDRRRTDSDAARRGSGSDTEWRRSVIRRRSDGHGGGDRGAQQGCKFHDGSRANRGSQSRGRGHGGDGRPYASQARCSSEDGGEEGDGRAGAGPRTPAAGVR